MSKEIDTAEPPSGVVPPELLAVAVGRAPAPQDLAFAETRQGLAEAAARFAARLGEQPSDYLQRQANNFAESHNALADGEARAAYAQWRDWWWKAQQDVIDKARSGELLAMAKSKPGRRHRWVSVEWWTYIHRIDRDVVEAVIDRDKPDKLYDLRFVTAEQWQEYRRRHATLPAPTTEGAGVVATQEASSPEASQPVGSTTQKPRAVKATHLPPEGEAWRTAVRGLGRMMRKQKQWYQAYRGEFIVAFEKRFRCSERQAKLLLKELPREVLHKRGKLSEAQRQHVLTSAEFVRAWAGSKNQ
jgi:hypothetical protein